LIVNDTATAEARRPSPRPHPAGAPSRPVDRPDLRVVPPPDDMFVDVAEQVRNPEMPNAGSNEGPPESEITAGQGAPTVETDVPTSGSSLRVKVSDLWTAAGAYWTPPALFTDRPASLAELSQYARTAPWTAQTAGLLRAAGIWHYRLVGYPKTVVNRYSEWVWQRPLRLAAHLAGLKLAASTGPGIWLVDHIVYPVAQFAGHLFL
jgi:hypothetical protein